MIIYYKYKFTDGNRLSVHSPENELSLVKRICYCGWLATLDSSQYY